jgi:hypothetical protein
MTNDIYYKATMKGGKTQNGYIYKIGLNTEPESDSESTESCGNGLHLAKKLTFAKHFYTDEIYEAKAGVILGEDENKIRCSYVWIIRQLSKEEISRIEVSELSVMDRQNKLDKIKDEYGLNRGIEPICGMKWIEEHGLDITQEMYDLLTMSVKSEHHEVTLKNNHKLSKKDIKQAIAAVV